jgi:CheY-like chemotaxis protein
MTDEIGDRDTVLADLKILIVEDEAIIAFLLEDMLVELGCRDVRLAADVEEALDAIAERQPDVAVLDVNLAGVEVFPVADKLKAGGIPFVFTTGYGRDGLPAHWADTPVVQKPFRAVVLAAALTAVVAGRSASA